jgi:hypothetical protein
LGKLFHDYRVGLPSSGSRVENDNATSSSTGDKLGNLADHSPGRKRESMANGCHAALKLPSSYLVSALMPASTLATDNARDPSCEESRLHDRPRQSSKGFYQLTKKNAEHGCGTVITPHCFVNLQGYDCALSLALKRRAACTFAKSFLNLINNFAAFIQIGQESAWTSAMIRN